MTRIALVLGAGGAVGGAFHAAVLATLADQLGWDARSAEIIVGTSAGSATGAILRAGLAPGDLARRALGQPLSADGQRLLRAVESGPPNIPLRRENAAARRMSSPAAVLRAAARPWTVRPGTLAAAVLPAGTRPTEMITEGLDPLFGAEWPDRPLWLPAVDLDNGRRVVFGQTGAPPARVGEAVAASCAIPGFFKPVEIAGRRYVDGGAHSTTNLDLIGGLGLDLVVVSVPMGIAGRGLPLTADAGVRRFVRSQVQREAAGVRRRGTEIVAFQPLAADLAVMGVNAMDFRRRGAVVEQVRSSVQTRLQKDDPRFRLLRTPPP
ncbi:MAG: hypothetical protein QOD49_550 [Actinomycetota bacterium]|nr:hypothetical protein [Actinomycetota bacterium]